MSIANVRARAWCGTWNNYCEEDYNLLQNDNRWEYVIIGKEVGEQGTPHLQFYARAPNAIHGNSLISAYRGVHWSKAVGSPQQNIDYCSKGGNFVEVGERPLPTGVAGDLRFLYIAWKELEEALWNQPDDVMDTISDVSENLKSLLDSMCEHNDITPPEIDEDPGMTLVDQQLRLRITWPDQESLPFLPPVLRRTDLTVD